MVLANQGSVGMGLVETCVPKFFVELCALRAEYLEFAPPDEGAATTPL